MGRRKKASKEVVIKEKRDTLPFLDPDDKVWGTLSIPAAEKPLFLRVCKELALNPFLNHLQVLGGKLYITNGGLKHIATMSQRLDGIEVSRPAQEGGEWHCTAKVWLKDCKMPFVEHGHAGPGNVSNMLRGKFEPEMAKTRALNRALRMAFNVSLCSSEELPAWDRVEHPEPVNITPPEANNGDYRPPSPPPSDNVPPAPEKPKNGDISREMLRLKHLWAKLRQHKPDVYTDKAWTDMVARGEPVEVLLETFSAELNEIIGGGK